MTKAIKQFFIVAAVVAISMVFVIQFRPGTNVEVSGGPTCAAEIGGECIPQSDFAASLRLAAPNVDSDILKQLRIRKVVMDGLVERWLLTNDAKRLGITVSDQELTEQLGKGLSRFSLPVAQQDAILFMLARHMPGQLVPAPEGPARRMHVEDPKTGKFDYERYKRWVGRMSTKTLADFREWQKAEAIAARMRALIGARVRVSEKEAFVKFARENEKAVVDYVKLERGFFRDHVVDRSDEALSTWSDEHKEEVDKSWSERKESYLPECRQARHILVRFDETVPDEEEQKKKAREKIEKIQKRLENGDAFGAVAKELSEDPRTKRDGGKLGCFAQGKLAAPNTGKAIDDAVYALEPGKVSDVIETGAGLHLVKLDKVLDEAAAEKLGRRDVALELYLKEESERLAAEAAKQILEAVRGGKTLAAALDAHLEQVLPEDAKKAFERGRGGAEKEEGAPDDAWDDPTRPEVKTSDAFTQGTPPFSQVQNPADASKMLFQLDKPGAVPSDVIKLIDGYAVAQLKEKKAVDDKAWDEKRVEYMAALERAKQRDAVVAYIQRLKDKYLKDPPVIHAPLGTEDESAAR